MPQIGFLFFTNNLCLTEMCGCVISVWLWLKHTHAHIWRLSLWLVLIQIIGMFYVSHQRWKLICVEMFKEALHTNNHRIKEFFSWDAFSVEQIKSNVGAKTFPSAVKQKKSVWIISAFTSVGITDARVWCSIILFRFFTD